MSFVLRVFSKSACVQALRAVQWEERGIYFHSCYAFIPLKKQIITNVAFCKRSFCESVHTCKIYYRNTFYVWLSLKSTWKFWCKMQLCGQLCAHLHQQMLLCELYWWHVCFWVQFWVKSDWFVLRSIHLFSCLYMVFSRVFSSTKTQSSFCFHWMS